MEFGSIFDINIDNLFLYDGHSQPKLPFLKADNISWIKYFNTGRSAIEYLLRYQLKLKNQKVLLPSFICSSVTDAFFRAGVNFGFYNITSDLQPDIDDISRKLDNSIKAVFVAQYFGKGSQIETTNFMTGLHNSNITIIEDITQSCLSDHGLTIAYGDYIIASLRKWFPIPDGAILISRQGTALVDLELESGVNDYSFYYFIAQIMKQHYLYGQKFNKNVFLQFTRKATDALFSDYTIRDMTDLSKGLLNSQNIKEIIVSRRRNYNRLYQKINNPNIEKLFYLQSNDVPIGFPVICKNRDLLKQYLINNDIYCNVHWEIKNQIQLKDLQCAKLSKNILTIPCDQRYSVNEMDYMIDKINKFHIGKEL